MSEKVSIITPTYQRQHLFPLIYKCVAHQDWPDFEWLILDDSEAPSSFFAKLDDPRVRYFHDPSKKTIGEKRNILISRSSGGIIAHFDDDDYYAPGYLRYMVSAMRETGAGMSKLTGWFLYNITSGQFGYWDLLTKGVHVCWSKKPAELFHFNSDNLRNFHIGYGFSYVFDKKIWDGNRFDDRDWREDHFFIVRALKKTKVIGLADQSGLCIHLVGKHNTSKTFPQYIVPSFLITPLFPEWADYLRLAQEAYPYTPPVRPEEARVWLKEE